MSSEPSRRAILDEAVRAFGARGYHGTSMREVAVGAGIDKSVIYYWFASKQALWEGAVAECSRALVTHFEGPWRPAYGETPDPRRWIRGYVESILDWGRSRPDAARLLARSLVEPPPLQNTRLEGFERLADELAALAGTAPLLDLALQGLVKELLLRTLQGEPVPEHSGEAAATLLLGGPA